MKSEEDYETFINRIAQNPIAVEVKINDLLDNLDITRFKNLNERDLKRLNKYLKAFWELQKSKPTRNRIEKIACFISLIISLRFCY